MSKVLKLAEDLRLPLDAVTQTFLVVGKRGSGKSNTAARFVEQLYHAGLPFVVLDPVDTWWGLKAGRDGGRGLDVYVFGGRKQDLPLEPGGGALIAEVLCEHRMPMVLSVKHLSGGERSRFMVAFAQTLFQKWGGGPLHVVLEEAHELAPQMSGGRGNTDTGDAAMLGAFKRLWKLGRASGIGGTAVTQRPASLSKDITTQSEILIAHRTIGPQDVKAIGEWVKYHGEHQDILADLPSLPTGEAFIWAPEFPEGKPIGLQRTTVLLRETYDSASTPKVGEHRVEPKELAAVDLERLRTKMAATIEKAKQDDPRELRKLLQEKDRKIQALEGKQIPTAPGKTVEVLTDADRELLKSVRDEFLIFSENIADKADLALTAIAERAKAEIDAAIVRWTEEVAKRRQLFCERLEKTRVQKVLDKIDRFTPSGNPGTRVSMSVHPQTVAPKTRAALREAGIRVAANMANGSATSTSSAAVELGTSGAFRMLTTLAQHAPDPITLSKLALRSGIARNGGTFRTYLGKLKTLGWAFGQGSMVAITQAGLEALGPVAPLPTGDELVAYWQRELGDSGARRMFDAIVAAYPQALTADELEAQTNIAAAGGTFRTYLGKLRTLDLVTRGPICASEELFE